jgi:hypothetical protein
MVFEGVLPQIIDSETWELVLITSKNEAKTQTKMHDK